jgi:opacity protein-like surface antigen
MSIMLRTPILSLLIFVVLPLGAQAQGVKSGSIELSANGGITNLNGIDNKRGHGSFGFAGAYNLTSHLALIGEYNYIVLGSRSEDVLSDGVSAGTLTGKEDLQLYGAAARFSLINTRFVVPYVLVGGGGNRVQATATFQNQTISGSESGGYFAVGGGASFYLSHGFGVRPEFRYERQQFAGTTIEGIAVSGSGGNDLRATGALFYQFGGRGTR